MSDIAITASGVVAQAGASKSLYYVTSGNAAITAGQSCYVNSAGYLTTAKADASGTQVATGIALDNASQNQPCQVCTGGSLLLAGTSGMVQGAAYVVSAANTGGIAPISDLTSGQYTSLLGIATSPTTLNVSLLAPGVVHL